MVVVIFSKQIEKIYRSKMYNRCDDVGVAHYFSAEDFPGLRSQGFSFPANAGHTLQGWFYSYDKAIPGRLVVFDHGMGGGHRSYMREIERLARAGYALSPCDKRDIIFSFFIENGVLDMIEIDIALEELGLPCFIE